MDTIAVFYNKALKWLAIAAFLVAAGLAIVQTLRLHTAQLDQAEAAVALATERREAAVRLAQEQAQVRKTENTLQASAAQTRNDIHAATFAITTERDALLNRVRLAEARAAKAALSRASAAAGTPEAGPVGDGTGLLATIGSADVDEAYRANLIRVALLGCYRDYDAAEAALKALQHD